MTWGVVNIAMLAGLAGAFVPLIIHLLNRRNEPVIDWAAMSFLELEERSRRRLQPPTEWLLLATRMALLALLAVALARPFWSGKVLAAKSAGQSATNAAWRQTIRPRRDLVLIIDGSDSMAERTEKTTPHHQAIAWARRFLNQSLGSGDTVSILLARDRVRSLFDSPSFDRARIEAALKTLPEPRGSSDLPNAIAEGLRILAKTNNPDRHVIILSDAQKFAWRTDELSRWELLRELHMRSPAQPSIWSLAFSSGKPGTVVEKAGPNGSIGPIQVSRGLITPGLTFSVTTSVQNSGPGTQSREVEFSLDGIAIAGSRRSVGLIAPGGSARVEFEMSIESAGSHLLSARLNPSDDPLPRDDLSTLPLEVEKAIAVLVVDGDRSPEPFRGETDFLRAALAPPPEGAEAERFQVRVIIPKELDSVALANRALVVLADIDRLTTEQWSALGAFVESGGGVVCIPGDRIDPTALNQLIDPAPVDRQKTPTNSESAWFPAKLGDQRGSFRSGAGGEGFSPAVHPDPGSFQGQALAPLGLVRAGRGISQRPGPAGAGEEGRAPLASASLFAHWNLEPLPGSSVLAKLNNQSPWIVERKFGRGTAIVLAGPLDANGGTLPVNPDFIPLVHELMLALARGHSPSRLFAIGEPLTIDLGPGFPETVKTLALFTPDGAKVPLEVLREGDTQTTRTPKSARPARIVYEDTSVPGVYRLASTDLPGGSIYAQVNRDPRESNLARIESVEESEIAHGWQFVFETDPETLASRLAEQGSGGGSSGTRREVWRLLIFGSLGMLCIEVFLTRKLVRARGLEAASPSETAVDSNPYRGSQ